MVIRIPLRVQANPLIVVTLVTDSHAECVSWIKKQRFTVLQEYCGHSHDTSLGNSPCVEVTSDPHHAMTGQGLAHEEMRERDGAELVVFEQTSIT